MPPTFWSRVREARLLRVVIVYLASSWLLLQVTSLFIQAFDLPKWFMPAAVLLLLIGLVIITATAWVQSHPSTAARAEAEEIPGSWEIDLGDMKHSVARGRLPHLTWARAILGGVVAFSLLFGLAGVYVVVQDRGRSFSPPEAVAGSAGPGIAVLPFSVRGEGLDVWREGMVDVLSTNLDGVTGLRAIDSRTVLARWREAVGERDTPDLSLALGAARHTGAQYAVVGNAVAAGSELRFTADIFDLKTGDKLGQGQAQGSPDSILGLVDRFAIDILRALARKGAVAVPRVNLASITTSSPPALRDFLEGEVLYRRSDFAGAADAYQRAVEADTSFALALYRLSQVLGWSGKRDEEARMYKRAAHHASRLPEREALIIRATELARTKSDPAGIALARDAVQRYPDDPDLWYQAGELYYHSGQFVLVPQDETEAAFARAIALDPGFAPAYIHLIEMAFTHHADSARAHRLIDSYRRLAPGTLYDKINRTAFQLVFGDTARRQIAREAFDTLTDTLSRTSIGEISEYLGHPAHQAAEVAYARARLARDDANVEDVEFAAWLEVRYGRPRRLVETLAQYDLRPGQAAEILHRAHYLGLSVPRELLDRVLALEPGDSISTSRAFHVALYAAEQGRWADYDSSAALVRRYVAAARAANDSTKVAQRESILRGMEGYALWKRGRPDEAATVMESAGRAFLGGATNWDLRWFLGQLFLETGKPAQAKRYLQSFWHCGCAVNELPLSYFYLGKALEELEEYDKARHSYELFVIAWKDADPELQPRVEEARAAIQRLTSVIRE